MADITMCSRKDCPLSQSCYRKLSTINDKWQSYYSFSYCVDSNGNTICHYYEKCEIVKKDT